MSLESGRPRTTSPWVSFGVREPGTTSPRPSVWAVARRNTSQMATHRSGPYRVTPETTPGVVRQICTHSDRALWALGAKRPPANTSSRSLQFMNKPYPRPLVGTCAASGKRPQARQELTELELRTRPQFDIIAHNWSMVKVNTIAGLRRGRPRPTEQPNSATYQWAPLEIPPPLRYPPTHRLATMCSHRMAGGFVCARPLHLIHTMESMPRGSGNNLCKRRHVAERGRCAK